MASLPRFGLRFYAPKAYVLPVKLKGNVQFSVKVQKAIKKKPLLSRFMLAWSFADWTHSIP